MSRRMGCDLRSADRSLKVTGEARSKLASFRSFLAETPLP
jgi:hypothetical protein